MEKKRDLSRQRPPAGRAGKAVQDRARVVGIDVRLLEQIQGLGVLLELTKKAVGLFPVRFLKTGDMRHNPLEELDACAQGLQEALLLGLDRPLNKLLLFGEPVELTAHLFEQRVDEAMQKRLFQPQGLVAVADSPAQDTTDDVASSLVARHRTVGNGKGDCADVIGHHTESDPHLLAFIVIVDVQVVVALNVRTRGEIGHGLQQRREEVRVVRRLFPLQDGHHPLEAHTRVHVLVVERLQAAVGVRVVLDEDEVPQLHYLRVIGVYQFSSRGFASGLWGTQIHVQLRTRAAGPGVAHHPEVFLRRLVENPFLRQGRLCVPQVVRLRVGGDAKVVVPFMHRGVEPLRCQAPPLHQ